MLKKERNYFNIITKVIILITFVILTKIYLNQEIFLKALAVETLKNTNVFSQPFLEIKFFISDFLNFNKIRKDYLNLKEENLRLSSEINSCNLTKEENEILKEALKIKEEKKWQLKEAKVILIDPLQLSGDFWINKGLASGLKEGMNVITLNEVLVGRLTQCFKNSCKGESIYKSGIKIGVEDLRSKVLAVLEKDFRGSFYLKLVPPLADIEINDILVTSSENPNYLKGLLVAKVKEKITDSKNPEKEYILEPFLNRLRLNEVLVITNFAP